jgi:hypothetical protein
MGSRDSISWILKLNNILLKAWTMGWNGFQSVVGAEKLAQPLEIPGHSVADYVPSHTDSDPGDIKFYHTL